MFDYCETNWREEMFQVTGRQMQMIFRDWLIMNVTAVSGNSLSGKWKVLVVAII